MQSNEGALSWLLQATSLCCGAAGLGSTPLGKAVQRYAPLGGAPGGLGAIFTAPTQAGFEEPDGGMGTGPQGDGLQSVIVMRHAHRADEDDESWSITAQRPWDPPLSSSGRLQAHEAAQALAGMQERLQIEYVVSSPYVRCLQTSAEVVAALRLPPGRWLVDMAMGEICEPRLLVAGRPDVEERVEGKPLEKWMWDGTPGPEALRRFAEAEAAHSGLGPGIAPQLLGRPAPPYPEEHEEALERYASELGWVMRGGPGFRGNVLVVTHGEAVRSAVNMFAPSAVVYEVKHCSYVQLKQQPQEQEEDRLGSGPMGALKPGERTRLLTTLDSDRGSPEGGGPVGVGGWQLACKSGETGVSWFS